MGKKKIRAPAWMLDVGSGGTSSKNSNDNQKQKLYVYKFLFFCWLFSINLIQMVCFFFGSDDCINCLLRAQSVAKQFQLLHTLCSFVKNATDPLAQLLPFFKDKLLPYTFDVIKSIEWCTDVGGGGIPLAQQIHMLEHISHMTAMKNGGERSIYSELIESIKFDDGMTITFEVSRQKFRQFFFKPK